MKMLLAVDESKNAERMVEYVGTLLHRTPDITLTLLDVSAVASQVARARRK